MRVHVLALAGVLLPLLSAGAAAEPRIVTAVKHGIVTMQARGLVRGIARSPYTSNELKQEARATHGAIANLRSVATRIELGGATARYFSGERLLGTVAREEIGSQRRLKVTTTIGDISSTREVFRTGRGAVKLVAQELGLGLRGKKPWKVVLSQIRGELKSGSVTAGSRVVDARDIGRSDRTRSVFRVEQWRARGKGLPANASIEAPARARGKAVVGTWELRETRYTLDAGGNRIPHPDPEAGGKPMRETLASQRLGYHVNPAGKVVYTGFDAQ